METTILSRTQARWAQALSAHDFVLTYTPGKVNPADGPSRRPDHELGAGEQSIMLLTLQNKLRTAIERDSCMPLLRKVLGQSRDAGDGAQWQLITNSIWQTYCAGIPQESDQLVGCRVPQDEVRAEACGRLSDSIPPKRCEIVSASSQEDSYGNCLPPRNCRFLEQDSEVPRMAS